MTLGRWRDQVCVERYVMRARADQAVFVATGMPDPIFFRWVYLQPRGKFEVFEIMSRYRDEYARRCAALQFVNSHDLGSLAEDLRHGKAVLDRLAVQQDEHAAPGDIMSELRMLRAIVGRGLAFNEQLLTVVQEAESLTWLPPSTPRSPRDNHSERESALRAALRPATSTVSSHDIGTMGGVTGQNVATSASTTSSEDRHAGQASSSDPLQSQPRLDQPEAAPQPRSSDQPTLQPPLRRSSSDQPTLQLPSGQSTSQPRSDQPTPSNLAQSIGRQQLEPVPTPIRLAPAPAPKRRSPKKRRTQSSAADTPAALATGTASPGSTSTPPPIAPSVEQIMELVRLSSASPASGLRYAMNNLHFGVTAPFPVQLSGPPSQQQQVQLGHYLIAFGYVSGPPPLQQPGPLLMPGPAPPAVQRPLPILPRQAPPAAQRPLPLLPPQATRKRTRSHGSSDEDGQ